MMTPTNLARKKLNYFKGERSIVCIGTQEMGSENFFIFSLVLFPEMRKMQSISVTLNAL